MSHLPWHAVYMMGADPPTTSICTVMEAQRWIRLRALFDAAVALPPERRPCFLDQACAGDPSLRGTLESLLVHHDLAPAFINGLRRILAGEVAHAAEALLGKAPAEVPRYISHFQILEELDGGGMGTVYLARDVWLGRLVALKFLRPYLCTNAEARARFVHEAKAASALDHPNIATIYEIDATEPAPGKPEGQLFIAMAYYAGETLRQKISHGPLRLEDCLDFAFQTVQGLAKAHEHGISHRDIKPANLIVTDDGWVKIVDFGLAKMTGVCHTKPGTAMGTAAYMSPEQARAEAVDHRTDIWSLGVVLYEMLAGQRPFPGTCDPAVLYTVLNEDHKPLRALRGDLPAELEAIVERCLEKDRTARYQTTEALQEDLMRVRRQVDRERAADRHPVGHLQALPAYDGLIFPSSCY